MTALGVASIMGTAVAPAARGALRSNGIVFVSPMSSANEQTSHNCAEECMTTKQKHETTGTARRGAHHMSGRRLVFQVAADVQSLRHDLEFTSGGRAAKTFVKTAGLRLTLVLIKQGFGLNPEATAGGASIEVVEGRLCVQADGQPWDVGAGELIALADNLREPITALEDTAFLLTVAWPAGAGAWEQEMAGREV